MARTKTQKSTLDQVPNLEVPLVEIGEQNLNEATVKYVVVRSGVRVSDKDYETANEPKALAEKEFWQKVVERWPDGTKIEIVQFDKKKHRIW